MRRCFVSPLQVCLFLLLALLLLQMTQVHPLQSSPRLPALQPVLLLLR